MNPGRRPRMGALEMSTTDGSFDLFSARADRKVEAVLIVTPYVKREFFDELLRRLRPRSLHVVLDDGCRAEDVDMVRETAADAPRQTRLSCVLGSAPGLVHMKLFYIVWRTGGGRTGRTLVFGSANATRQGFSGALNAELIASCRLTRSGHSAAIAWCEAMIAASLAREPVVVDSARDLPLHGIKLRLPRVHVGRARKTISSFDLWVQRGSLLATYRPEPGFLRVAISLKASLGESDLSRTAMSTGFEVPQVKRLTYALVGGPGSSSEGDHDDEAVGDWRSRYFTWTQLGYWCSEQCHAEFHAQFRRRGHEEREQQLRRLSELRTPAARERARGAFLGSVERLWHALGDRAAEFLDGGDAVAMDRYAEIFEKRVKRDLELIEDDEFRERYVTGFEIVQVPRFRTDLRGWREFLDSMARQLSLENARQKPRSRLLRAIRRSLEEGGGDPGALEEPGELLDALRGMWGDAPTSARRLPKRLRLIAHYHRD